MSSATSERLPPVPRTALDTVRHALAVFLGEGPVSAGEISSALGIGEKEVYGHLEHIRRSIHAGGGVLVVTPAACRACGFVFAKREKLKPPGRCPVCRSEAISDPLFHIRPLPVRGER